MLQLRNARTPSKAHDAEVAAFHQNNFEEVVALRGSNASMKRGLRMRLFVGYDQGRSKVPTLRHHFTMLLMPMQLYAVHIWITPHLDLLRYSHPQNIQREAQRFWLENSREQLVRYELGI